MFKLADDRLDEQRKQELHRQQVRFNDDKHQIDMESLSLKLQQSQRAFDTKQEQQQEKEQAQQQAEQQQAEQQQAQTQQAHVQQHDTQRQNIMAKAAAMYTDELEPLFLSSALPAAGVGTAMGAGAAHALFPSEATKSYREMSKAINPEDVRKSLVAAKQHGKRMPQELFETVNDISRKGNKVRFKAPAHVRQNYFNNRALQSNAKRLFQGSGIGLLAGLLAYKASQG